MNKFYFLILAFVSVCVIVVLLFVHGKLYRRIPLKPELSVIGQDNSKNIAEHQSGISFEREKISIHITYGRVSVSGNYFLHNHDEGKRIMPLSYPFPVNKDTEFPDSISVSFAGDYLPIPFEKDEEHGVVFFAVPVRGLTEFVVYYSQKIHRPTARYILTTTHAWKEPLKSAEFTIKTPQNFDKLDFNYKPDLTISEHDCIFYLIKRTDFLPEKDLEITW